MDSLLKHRVDMTAHRDHTRLDLSVVAAVQELADALQTRVLTIATVREQRFVRPRASIDQSAQPRLEEVTEGLGEPISEYPALEACLDNHEGSAEQLNADGNLVLTGKQEVRVNNELRELAISGVVRTQDIGSDNMVRHDRMAEARIAYGGRGQITDVQQPRYGQQLLDVILPF